jgi:BASS family bile acid:Na+ symporter
MSYGALSGLVLVFALLAPDPGIHDGWVLMAAVPPAVAVIPITSILKGDVRRALISLALIYLLGLVLVPLITLVFTDQPAPVSTLVVQTLLLIGVPLLASQPLRRWPAISNVRPTAVGLSFFVLVLAIAGSTRAPLLARPELVISLSAFSFARTFGLGLVVLLVARALQIRPEERVAVTTFSSFKNLGLTVVLAFSMFGAAATLPSIFCLVFEILWLAALPVLFARIGRPADGIGK